MTTDLSKEIVWSIADGTATEKVTLAAFDEVLRVLRSQLTRRSSMDSADPCLNIDDLRQEAWLKFLGWCRSYPRDGAMSPEQWFRVCWRNVSINLSISLERKRPRHWPSLNKMEDDQRESIGEPLDSPAPETINLNEIWRDLCRICDRTDMPPKVRKRMNRFLCLRLHGYSVREAALACKYLSDHQGEILRKTELLVIGEYLGHKPLSR
jgi:DNA-directed RNA polymerase specialized sigma24 family protein